MTAKCFKGTDCFQSLHCIVKSVTWLEILKIDPIACKYSKILDVATTSFNSFIKGSDNDFMGLTTTLLSFRYVKVTLSWVWRDSK